MVWRVRRRVDLPWYPPPVRRVMPGGRRRPVRVRGVRWERVGGRVREGEGGR